MNAVSKSILSGLAAALVASSATFGWVCYSTNPNSRLPVSRVTAVHDNEITVSGEGRFSCVEPDYDLAYIRACLAGVIGYVVVFAPVLFRLSATEESGHKSTKRWRKENAA
jgi:hypothetical protein